MPRWTVSCSRRVTANLNSVARNPQSISRLPCPRSTLHSLTQSRPYMLARDGRLHIRERCKSELLRSYLNDLARHRRKFSMTSSRDHGHIDPPKKGEELNVTFIDKDGVKSTFQVAKGDNLLDIAQANDLEMEGACGGSCACSTCHVIVEDSGVYDKLDEPDDDENDMLDLAFGLTETSRLGCQVKMSSEIDGMVVKLPSMTRNLQASDFEKK